MLQSIVPSLPAPRPTGTTVTFTANASGGVGPFQYKWFVFDGAWNVAQNWSTSNTFAWTPATGSDAYRIAVWVRSAGNTADAYENANSNASIAFPITGAAGPPPLSIAALTANLASPQAAGTPITFNATASGGTSPYQFKWRVSTNGGSTFTTLQDWSASAAFTWTPATAIADARISVWARNSGITADAPQAQAIAAFAVTAPAAGPLVLNGIVPNLSSPQPSGTAITFTANASGGIGPLQYKWWVFDGIWNVARDWTANNTFTWTPVSGSSGYRIAVWVRSAGSTADTYDNANANGSIGYPITGAVVAAPTIGGLTSSVPSPQVAGTPIAFATSASGGTGTYQFKWQVSVDGGATFTTGLDWGPNASFTWTPSAATANARISVWLRNLGETADMPQGQAAQATMLYVITPAVTTPLALHSIVPDVPAPRPSGMTITFTANATGGAGPLQYKWWVFDGAWNVVQNWSTSTTFAWTPASGSSAYRIAVWVRSAGNTADSYENANSNGSIAFPITGAPAPQPLAVSLTSLVPSPQTPGTTVTFAAAAANGTSPYQFKWRLSTDGGTSFTTVQDWSGNASFTWTPGSAVASARVTVWARSAGATADAPQAEATLPYVITTAPAAPLVLNAITSDLPEGRPAMTTITFTANASGGIGPLQYKWWVFNGSWQVVRDWSTSNAFAWTPMSPSNAYRVAVWVRNAGSTADAYDNASANGSIGFVIVP